MVAEFGPFAPVFEKGELPVPGYLSLLNMTGTECQAVLRRVQQALDTPGEINEYIRRFLAQPNWRHHLVAAVATLISKQRSLFADSLWSAIDGGSWVAPQLAATLYFADPEFVAHAKHRVEMRCPVRVPEGLSLMERHSATGPAGLFERSAKNMAALLRIIADAQVEAEWLRSEQSNAEVAEMLKSDVDSSGEIAAQWLRASREQFAAFGITLIPPTA